MQDTDTKDTRGETPAGSDDSPRFRQVTGLADKVTAAQYMRKLRLLTTAEPTLAARMWAPPRLRAAMLQTQEAGDQVLVLERVPATGRDELPWDVGAVALFTVPPRVRNDPTAAIHVDLVYVTDEALSKDLTAKVEQALGETCRRLGRGGVTGQLQRHVPLDKYAVENRNPECLECGACCMGYYVVNLTEQDLADGIEYDLKRPYLLRQKPDGTCWYYDASRRMCEIYEKRPIVCRQFTCARPGGRGARSGERGASGGG